MSGQFFAEHHETSGFHPSYRHEEPASPTTCVTLLTGGLLVRIQPEEPTFSMDWRRRPAGRLANSGQFRSDSIGRFTCGAVEHLRVDVEVVSTFVWPMIAATCRSPKQLRR